MCEKHALTEAAGKHREGLNCPTDIQADSVSKLYQHTPPMVLFAGLSAANVLALQALLLMKSPVAGFR